MAISTIITSSEAPYTNASPIPFTITFSASVTGLTLNDLNLTNGTATSLSGSGAVYIANISPTTQGSVVSLRVPASVATGPGPAFELNSISNLIESEYLSIKPRAKIGYDGSSVTNSRNIKVKITFDRTVTGFVKNDFSLVNASVYSLTGTGSVYNAVISPIKTGKVEFWINGGAASDVFGNTSTKSNIITLIFDPTSFDLKSDVIDNEITDPDILLDFELGELSQVAQIQNLSDCAKNIPQRLLEMATSKAFSLLSENNDVKKLAATTSILQQNVETIKAIVEQVQQFKENPETLLQAVLDSQGLTGEALRQKMQAISDKFGAVSGLNNVLSAIQSSGICGQQDYFADGSVAPKQTLTPTDVIPPEILGVSAGVQTNTYDSNPKDAYDEFTFQLKEQLELDVSQPQDADRSKMISVITTLAMGYHDDISKTIDESKDTEIFNKFTSNVEFERVSNLGWADDIQKSFASKTSIIGQIIQRNTSVIRAFYNRNVPSGSPISVGVTTYSGPADDFFTLMDIKPSQRPPALVAKYAAQGMIIPAGNTYTNSKGKTFKIGTLNYSDAFNGAYGKPLVSDKSVASTRFPGGSIISLRNPDGSAYDPTGKNPSGQYTVDDTGNAEATWKKPDIFTLTPELYKNTESVQVFLISKGTAVNKQQYQIAQRTYGSGGVA